MSDYTGHSFKSNQKYTHTQTKSRRVNVMKTHVQVQNWTKKIMSVLSLRCTLLIQSTLCLIFLICGATMHHWNYSGRESKVVCAVYDSDISVNFEGYQTWYELINTKQGINHAKFETAPLNSVSQKVNVKVFVRSENMLITSLHCVQKWKIVLYSLSTWLT